LGLYFRLGRNDHRVISQLLSEGRAVTSGIVFDPEYVDAHEEIRNEIGERNMEAVLDTRLMELATPMGCTRRRETLPWGSSRPQTLADFPHPAIARIAEAIARFVVTKRFTAVLAPTHFLADGANDPWFGIDRELVHALREALDSRGASSVAIYYPLALPTRMFFDRVQRLAFRSPFQGLRVDGVWLRVHPFGSDRGHLTLQRYIAACHDLQSLSLPLVAERTGSVGLALLAFGAVGGIESGVSSGERFDFRRLTRKRPSNGGFAPHQRVYFPSLGIFLTRERAESFLQSRSARANFACADTACCRRGAADMVADPRRHFVFTRMGEVAIIGGAPPSVRAAAYLDRILRPATDRLGRALQFALDAATREKLETERRKLDGWRHTLGEMARNGPDAMHAVVPRRRILRQHRRAEGVRI
jgi:hypothetical protein